MNRNSDSFIGGSFTWFTGVVEDRFDPEELNRVRVRCFGFHSENQSDIDTEDLPWATVMMPTTASGTSGIGDTPHGLMEGSWVVGFFRDGPSAQDPIIMGSVAAKNSPRSKDLGFTGANYPTGDYAEESDVNYAARQTKYTTSNALQQRELGSAAVTSIQTASPPKVTTVATDKAESYYTESPFEVMPPLGDDRVGGAHVPDYPYNKVNESECGHVAEVDCTPGFERTNRMHTSGTYEEIYTDGTRSIKITGEDYEVVVSNKNVHIRGNCNMTIDGNLRQLVYGNYHLEVEKDMTMDIKGSLQQKIGANHETEVVRGRSTNIGTDDSLTVMNNSTSNIIADKLVTVGGNSTQTVTGSCGITSLANLNLFNAGTFGHTSLGNATLTVDATQTVSAITMDIDATSALTMDAPNGSIDLPAGNITSNNVKLHTHKHTEVPGTGGASSPSPATQATTAPISDT
jgi:hypothetical protein